MPDLVPELYVGTLNVENAGDVNLGNTGVVNIYGEEYLRVSQYPGLIYGFRLKSVFIRIPMLF